MAKSSITTKYNLTANGILSMENDIIGIENPDTGEFIRLNELLDDFSDKTIKLTVTYDEDYFSN